MHALLLLAVSTLAGAQSLADLCTKSHVQQSLPLNDFVGIVFNTASLTTNAVYNATVASSNDHPAAAGVSYCNVTVAYSHNGLNDSVQVWYHLPSPESYKSRFLATGGGGESINSGESGLLQGSVYGAVSGLTDGGFGSFNSELTDALLKANGTLDYELLFGFAYEAIHEMTIIGKQLTKNYYNSTSLYSYYFGCSEGGREGWSQVQRYQDQFDGAVMGAPAFRQAYQQTNHLTAGVIEKVMGYAPPPCELEKINNDTIEACDGLDGRVDGVVSRTDLCKLHYDQSASIGKSYYCAASSGGSGGMGGGMSGGMGGGMGGAAGMTGSNSTGGSSTGGNAGGMSMSMAGSSTPAQNGTVTAQGVAVAKAILAGLHDSQGRQVYMPYQPSATFDDAKTSYNSSSRSYYATASGIAVTWINMFLNQIDSSTLSLDDVTYDTLRNWILVGLQKYGDTLQTVWPDLEDFRANGGKIIHYHGESDFSVPTGSSVLYQESVRKTMYPGLGYNESYAQLDDWYRLFLVPGAGHCSPSTGQPDGPWPQTALASIIDWVEKGVNPAQLDVTVLSGARKGTQEKICSFPLRPSWEGNSSAVRCVYDQASLDTWYPNLTSIPIPVY